MPLFTQYYKTRVDILFKNYHGLENNPDEKTVHHMRIAYKQVRAINKFIRNELKANHLFGDQLYTLDTIFKNSGFVREIQINFKLLKRYEKKLKTRFPEFMDHAAKELSEHHIALINLIKKCDIPSMEEAERKLCSYLVEYEERKRNIKLFKYLKRKIFKTEFRLLEDTNRDKYHTIRMNIKEELFFLKLIFSQQSFKANQFNPEKLKQISNKLGLWHDRDMLLRHLHELFKALEIENYHDKNSNYGALINLIREEQNKFLKNIDRDILKMQLSLLNFLGQQEIDIL
jgi:CHAD domain-containing protein